MFRNLKKNKTLQRCFILKQMKVTIFLIETVLIFALVSVFENLSPFSWEGGEFFPLCSRKIFCALQFLKYRARATVPKLKKISDYVSEGTLSFFIYLWYIAAFTAATQLVKNARLMDFVEGCTVVIQKKCIIFSL